MCPLCQQLLKPFVTTAGAYSKELNAAELCNGVTFQDVAEQLVFTALRGAKEKAITGHLTGEL